MIPMLFKRKPATLDQPLALETFKCDLDRAISGAVHSQLDARVLSEILNARADVLRRSFAVSAPIRSAL